MPPSIALGRLAMARKYSTHLQSFTSSSATFRVLNPSSRPSNNGPLYILDSSFNPPTNAHLALALSSLPTETKATVLLLLAVQNADKQPKPASFDYRLEMMALLAHKIETQTLATALIALSKHPRFVDKARDVSLSFPSVAEVVWLVGFDTLTRILDKKYYLPKTVEESLREFWEKNRFVCAIRGDEEAERTYLARIRSGGVEGVPPSWADYITILEPVGKEDSSTRAREAAGKARWDEVGKVVPGEIAEYIRKEGLYNSKP